MIVRDDRIDILRFIGLAMIILAHVEPPNLLFQLRNFDVPLMVLISGMSFGLSYNDKENYIHYIWKRIKRLVFPVWIFLTIFFSVSFLIVPGIFYLDTGTVIQSYIFINGIGYVWIIRVFLLVAITAPFIYLYNKKESSNIKFIFKLLIFMFIFEVFRHISAPYLKNEYLYFISQCTHYVIPYSIIFALGLRLNTLSKKEIKYLALVFIVIFIALAILLIIKRGGYISTQQFKYPPSIYYLSYAIFFTLILLLNINSIKSMLDFLKLTKISLFIAKNSIWVYLWHIPLVLFIEANFIIKFIIAMVISTLITYTQINIVEKFILNRIESQKLKKNIKTVLTG